MQLPIQALVGDKRPQRNINCIQPFLFKFGIRHASCDLLNDDTHEVGARLASDVKVRFSERDEEDVDVESGESGAGRIRVECRDGF